VARPDADDLLSHEPSESTEAVAERVARARSRLAAPREHVPVDPDAGELIASKLRRGDLSARGMHKVECVARTIAALEGCDAVTVAHVAEAFSLRAGSAVIAA
jgi:magnesium chelatase family protein